MAQTTYDSFKKTCKNGYPQYYGVTLDPVTGEEQLHEMNGSDWIAAGQSQGYESLSLGCPSSHLVMGPGNTGGTGGRPRPAVGPKVATQTYGFNKPSVDWKSGQRLINYTRGLASSLKLPSMTIEKAIGLLPMRSFYLMDIRNSGGHVADPNNIFEILAEYARLHPSLQSPSQSERVAMMQPKSAPDMIGAGLGIAGDLVNLIGGAVENGNTQAFLASFATAMQNYMNNDFGEIRATLNATESNRGKWGGWGPKGALDMLLQYKNTSWKNLKNDITSYCQSRGINPVPSNITTWFDQQDALEAELRNDYSTSGGKGALNNGTQYSSQIAGGSSTGSGTSFGAGAFSGMQFDWKKWLPWIIGIVVFIILMVVIIQSSKRRKSNSKPVKAD